MLSFNLPVVFGTHIVVRGAYAAELMHNVMTRDFHNFAIGEAIYCGLLTPQGKVVCDFFCLRLEKEIFLLIVNKPQAEQMISQLRLYGRRRKVIIEQEQCYKIVFCESLSSNDSSQILVKFSDPRLADFACYALLPRSAAVDCAQKDISLYNEKRQQAGLCEADNEYPSRRMFAHEANMDKLGGIDFDKGCYIGQEVVSRLHHKGQVRKRLLPFKLLEGNIECNETVYLSDKRAGEVISVSGDGRVFVLLQIDRLNNENDDTIFTGKQARLQCVLPNWLKKQQLSRLVVAKNE